MRNFVIKRIPLDKKISMTKEVKATTEKRNIGGNLQVRIRLAKVSLEHLEGDLKQLEKFDPGLFSLAEKTIYDATYKLEALSNRIFDRMFTQIK